MDEAICETEAMQVYAAVRVVGSIIKPCNFKQ